MPSPVSLARNDSFHVDASADARSANLAFHGDLTEEADLDEVWDYIANLGSEVRDITIDLKRLHRINSVGILAWLAFLKKVQTRLNLKFGTVSEAVVEQASLEIPVFGKPGTPIASLEVPMFCEICSVRTSIFVDPAELLKTGTPVLPQSSCQRCQSPLKLDQLEQEYFHFLDTHFKKA